MVDLGIKNFIHEKGARNRLLNELHIDLNRLKSRIRCKIEQPFLVVLRTAGADLNKNILA